MLCKRKIFIVFPQNLTRNSSNSHLSNVSSQDRRDYLSPHLSPPPCISGEQLIWDPLLLCQVTSSQRSQLAITHANKSRQSPNASAGSHSHPDNISIPPAPHALTWSSHRYRVANGHFYESKQERVGHWMSPPADALFSH